MPLFGPLTPGFTSHKVVYMIFGSDADIIISFPPVFSSTNSTLSQVLPPFSVLKRPLCSFFVHKCPKTETKTISGLRGCIAISAIDQESSKPICCHVSPASTDLYIPVPGRVKFLGFFKCSPVPK